MKRGTKDHPKTKRLMRYLGIPSYAAGGLLEYLWAFAAEFAPAGDVGKFTDEDIAIAVGWEREPEELISALRKAKLLDDDEKCRFSIHDWWEHCEDAVHMKMARAKRFFIDGKAPRINRLPKEERAMAEEFYKSSAQQTDGESKVEESARRAHGTHTPSRSLGLGHSLGPCVRTVEETQKQQPAPPVKPTARIPPSPRKPNRKRSLRYDPVAILGAQTLMYHFVRRACDNPVRDWEPPDERLAEKFLDAAKGNLDWLTGFMAELERSGRKPERSYAWFVAMAHKVVAGEPVFLSGKGKLALMPPAQTEQPEERKSEAM